MIEGVDYSATANANWDHLAASIKASGRRFAGRYPVNDKSPGGRGITAAEYTALMAAGVDVFCYWQTTTNWMLGGFDAGVRGAQNAQANIETAGMPSEIPVYFACDFDAVEWQQAAIDDCLRGAASVIGFDRVGLYAGRWPIIRAMANGSARWFCQTSAWSGGVVVPGIHLYQYAYNQYIAGTNCDWVRAYQEHYGQASDYLPKPEPAFPAPELPPFYDRVNAHASPSRFEWNGNMWYPERTNVKARADTHVYTRPDITSPYAGEPIPKGTKVAVEWHFEDTADDGRSWLVNSQGYYPGSKFRPRLIAPK